MAKFNEYPVKTTPKDADKFMLYSAEDAANKLIDYDKLADAVLNKLTSKTFGLDAGTMTLPAALNQLNSNPNLMNLDNNIENFINASQKPRAYFVWGTIGGLFGGWAWGILMCSSSIRVANFIGINNASNSIAAATYKKKTWTKISIIG
jgi:hypothetical protein|nr:MAG TPA: hypothetical protein [Caudoviricetes sp.]